MHSHLHTYNEPFNHPLNFPSDKSFDCAKFTIRTVDNSTDILVKITINNVEFQIMDLRLFGGITDSHHYFIEYEANVDRPVRFCGKEK